MEGESQEAQRSAKPGRTMGKGDKVERERGNGLVYHSDWKHK